MIQLLKTKLKESFLSVLPISIIVLIIATLFVPESVNEILVFMFGAFFLMVGMTLFTIGAETSMVNIGNRIGSYLTKTKNLAIILISTFIIGLIVTIAEPDLFVLSEQASSIPKYVLIFSVAIGAGFLLVFAVLRTLFNWSISKVLLLSYGLLLFLCLFVSNDIVSLAFDSGGVTTGAISVPFIMALGVGISSMLSDKGTNDSCFGYLGLATAGPVLAVIILGLFYRDGSNNSYDVIEIVSTNSIIDIILLFIREIPNYMKEVGSLLLPIVLFFLGFQVTVLKLNKKNVRKIFVGIIIIWLGLSFYLTGVNVGFMQTGYLLGSKIVGGNFRLFIIPIGMLIGYFTVAAEPSVYVLKEQVYSITNGVISKKVLDISLGIGVSLSVGISMLRVLTGISIWYFLIPGYIFALVMTFFVSDLFTGIAFDSGGVTAGTMATAFLLPLAIGATETIGGNVLTDAFGLIALVSMTPLITVQAVGLIYKLKTKRKVSINYARFERTDVFKLEVDDSIVYFD